jgi:light-regulated signal transduction histidine kinase (bacteriophytochrome)
MTTLIDDLLLYSEFSQQARLEEVVDLNLLIKQVLSDLDLEIEEKGATVEVGNLFTVKGHRRQLQQAFQNLIANALKYVKAEVAPVIKIECKRFNGALAESGENYFEISVRDNGIGFDQSNADRIFNVFTRLHGMQEYKGSGVGLSIVRKVIENHQGRIWAESRLGEGSTFKVLLPAS